MKKNDYSITYMKKMITELTITQNQSKHTLNDQNPNVMEFIDTYADQFFIARINTSHY